MLERFGCSAKRVGATGVLALGDDTSDAHWADVLSIGESDPLTTGVVVCQFLQTIGNGGGQRRAGSHTDVPMMRPDTARKLQQALRETVTRGSGRGVADTLRATAWSLGGKTGTGPNVVGPTSDGWFAGPVYDPAGVPRYAFATFIRHGGKGGGNAAQLSAEVARRLIERDVR